MLTLGGIPCRLFSPNSCLLAVCFPLLICMFLFGFLMFYEFQASNFCPKWYAQEFRSAGLSCTMAATQLLTRDASALGLTIAHVCLSQPQ